MGKWKKAVAALASLPMMVAGLALGPSTALAADTATLEENGGITVPTGDANATITNDADFGKVVNISGGWIGGSATDGVPTKAVATFKDATVFNKVAWTLNADVKLAGDANEKSSAFTIGTKGEAVNLLLGTGQLGYGATAGGASGKTAALSKTPAVGQWAALSVVYSENDTTGNVAVYMDGDQILAPTALGFKLSAQQGTQAFIGHGYETSFVLNGTYDGIAVADSAATADTAKKDTADRLAAKKQASVLPGAGEHGNNGYLWLHFEATDYEKIYYGYSADGVTWTKLNDNQPLITSDVANKGIRDPHLIKLNQPDADGYKYVMIGTDLHAEGSAGGKSWSQKSQNLIVSRSKDLVTWTKAEAVFAGWDDANRAWAPEAIYDEAKGEYLVYWSSKPDSNQNTPLGVYKSYTKDFKTFTTPTRWIDESSVNNANIIDTTIVKGEDGNYYRFSTSDWSTVIDTSPTLDADHWTRLVDRPQAVNADGTSKIAEYQKANNPAQGDQKIFTTDAMGLGGIEGLTVFRMNDGSWRIMGDNQGYRAFSIGRLASLKNGIAPTKASSNFPQRFRHGTVVELTAAEQKAVLDAYGEGAGTVTPVEPDAAGSKPIASYDFEDGKGTDTTGNKHDLTFNGNAKVAEDSEKGNTLRLDGSDGTYAEFPKGLFDGRNKLTVQMDVKSEIDAAQFTFTFGQNDTKYYFLKYNNTGELASRITTASYQNEDAANATLTGNGAWHKVTVTLDDNVMTVYSDGVQVAQNKDTKNKVTDLGRNLLAYLGKSFYNDPYFKGSYDNVNVWNRVLSVDEIEQSSPVALQGIAVGTVPADPNALRGTDDHSQVRSTLDYANKTVTTVLNRRGDAAKTPVTVTVNRSGDAIKLTVDGKAFTNGGTVDLTKDRKLGIDLGDGNVQTWTLKAATVGNNPVLPGQYADPDIDYFDGKFWIFPTTDGFSGWSGNYFHAFSSTDLVNWKDEGVILDVDKSHEGVKQDYWTENTTVSPWSVGSAWAPTIEKKNGKYYFYYCAKYPNGTSAIGVAVADSPAGPYKAADQPVVTRSMEGVTVGQAIDPSIFTDPNTGKSYILYGNGSPAIAELNDDMVSVKAGTVRKLNGLRNFRESVVVAYRDGKYHWTWSCDDAGSPNYHVEYGVSDSIDGEIEYKGVLLQKDSSKNLQGTAHQSDVHVTDANGNDRWFMAYHRHYTPLGVFTSGLGYHRETAIDEIHFDADGLMETIKPTDEGVTVQMADVTALNGAIDAAGKLTDGSKYTEESWKAFQNALDAAKKTQQDFLDHGIAQKTADKAATDLTAAQKALKESTPEPEHPAEGTLLGIKVTSEPTKTEYKLNETLDTTGLVVTATVADGKGGSTERALATDEYELLGFDSSKASDEVTVTVQAKTNPKLTDTFTVKVVSGETPNPGTKYDVSYLEAVTANYVDNGQSVASFRYDQSGPFAIESGRRVKLQGVPLTSGWTVADVTKDAAKGQVFEVTSPDGKFTQTYVFAYDVANPPSPKPQPNKPATKPGAGLSATGAAVAGVMGVVAVLAAAGIALTVLRKRRA